MICLTLEEKEALKKQHKKERDGRVRDRIKSVILRDKGWSFREIADALLLTEETIRLHIREYEASKKLPTENGGSHSKLREDQSALLCEHLEKNTQLYVKDIAAYVLSVFGVKYSISGMHSWLKSNGFT